MVGWHQSLTFFEPARIRGVGSKNRVLNCVTKRLGTNTHTHTHINIYIHYMCVCVIARVGVRFITEREYKCVIKLLAEGSIIGNIISIMPSRIN